MIGTFVLTIGVYLAISKVWVAVSIAIAIGAIKEINDYYFGGVASWEDMIANILGMCFAFILILYLKERRKEKVVV